MRIFTSALFISLAITVGVLVICLTAPKGKACQRTFQRTWKSSAASSSQPRSVAVADLNNDRYVDLVVANSGHNGIGIFFAKGDGNFADQQTISTGADSCPYSVAINDLNNDTYLDIVVANYGIHSIGIFLGRGNATFMNQKIFSLGSSRPLFVAAGDLNNDYRIDVVVVDYGTDSISVLLGYGNGSFHDPIIYSTGYDSLPYAIVLADFNRDSHLDIAVANYGTDNIGILLGFGNGTDLFGHGNGSFLPQTNYSIDSGFHPQYVAVGDMDQDNKADIIVVDSHNDHVYVLLGSGDGHFNTITTYDTGSRSYPFCVAVADLNNDNQSDIVVVNEGTGNVLTLVEYSNQPWYRKTNYHDSNSKGSGLFAVGDFDNDSILDILVITEQTLSLFVGFDDGTFSYRKTIYLDSDRFTPQYVCVGDVNNDNRTDFVTANKQSNVGVFLGHGNGTFFTMITYAVASESDPSWIALGDLNHDDYLDIVSVSQGSNAIGILLGKGDGTFGDVINYLNPRGYTPYSVTIADMNKDTHLDLLVTGTSCSIAILYGLGDGTLSGYKPLYPDCNSYLSSLVLTDFNSDNNLDIVVTSPDENILYVMLGDDNEEFDVRPPVTLESGSRPTYIITADFNNDTIPDIAVTTFGTDGIATLYGHVYGFLMPGEGYSTGSGSKPTMITTANFDHNKRFAMVVNLWGTGEIAVVTRYNAAIFRKEAKYFTGATLQAVSTAVGDFNRDNRSDIVVANSGTDNLGILFSSNNGSIGAEKIYPIGRGSHPQYVMVCDIEKDNQLDIVSVNSQDNSISVIVGYGNGTFAEQLKYSMDDGSYPYAIASGDFNNDHRLDLAVLNQGTNKIGIFFGFNYTKFQYQTTYDTFGTLTDPIGLVVNDFNNDSVPDIVAAAEGDHAIGVFLGQADGNFGFIVVYPTNMNSGPKGIVAGDFNNDNRLDIAVTNLYYSSVGIFLGCGNGSFNAMITSSTAKYFYPTGIASADLNKDSRMDIVVIADYDTNGVGVLLGYGNGRFAAMQTYLTGDGSKPASVAIADFNFDHNLDIVVANRGIDSVGILIGYGNGTFKDQVTFTTGTSSEPIFLAVGDFNNDNQLDIAVACHKKNQISILLGYGNGSFADGMIHSTGDGSLPISLGVADFNQDNMLDIVVANDGTKTIVIVFGCGNGSFLSGELYPTKSTYAPFAFGIGDFNNDSRLDFASAIPDMSNIDVFLSYSTIPFGLVVPYSLHNVSQPYSIVVEDLNHDGHSDIVLANHGSDNIGVLLGRGDVVFDDIMIYSTGNGSAPYSVALADLNSDHHFDIVVTNSGTDNIAIFFGDGVGKFVLNKTYLTGVRSSPYTVIINDFNNDHMFDIAVTNAGTSNVLLLYGNGRGTFENEAVYSLAYGYHPYSIAAGDLNGDGWLDIAVACYDTDHVEILMQLCQ